MSDKDNIFIEGFAEKLENSMKTKDKKDEENEVIEQLSWEEVSKKFETELTSKFIHELGKLDGRRFMSTYLQFAEYVMPKKQRIESIGRGQDTNLTINITKQVDQKVLMVSDILKDEGLELPEFDDKKTQI